MNKIVTDIVYFLGTLILPLGIGYFIGIKNLISEKFLDRLMDLNMMVLSTVLTLIVFWKLEFNAEYIWLPFLGLLMQIFPGIIAFSIVNKKFTNPLDKGSYILAALFANRTITGLLTVYIFFGESGYGLGRLIMLVGPFTFYMFGIPLSKYYRAEGSTDTYSRPPLHQLIFDKKQIPLLGIITGIILNSSGIPRPAVFTEIFPYLFGVNMWLFVIPVGASIRFFEMKKLWIKTADLLLIKFVAVPLFLFGISMLLNLEGAVLGTVMILSFTPSAIGAVIIARMYKLNTHLAMAAYLFTTGFYLVIIFPYLA